jgi:hypothetical protein
MSSEDHAKLARVDCAIAGKVVNIQFRAGQNILEPGRPYVRCSERDCQYVDLNQPPCPLRADMFFEHDESRALREHFARHPGERFCYACLIEKLALPHAVLRRLASQLQADGGAVIRPSRCVACRGRRVTIALPGGWAQPPSKPAPAPEPPPDHGRQVLAALETLRGKPACSACVALIGALSLADARRAIDDLGSRGAVSVDPHGTCGVCSRDQAVAMAS